jgi:hypothetical protein
MLTDARKKVLLDLFGSPVTLLPWTIGAGCMVLSWMFGGVSLLNFGAIMGGLIGFGALATRFANYKHLLTNQRKYEHEEALKEQTKRLDELDGKLVNDKDSRTQNSLREIRCLYQDLQDDLEEEDVSHTAYQIVETIDALFSACISQLEHSYDLHCTAMKMRGKHKKRIKAEREAIVQEVVETTNHIAKAVEKFHLLKSKKKKQDLSALRSELDINLEIAEKLDRQAYEDPDQDQAFEEYMKE